MLFDRRRVVLKSRSQIEKMAVAGRLTAAALDAVAEAIRPGLTPLQLNAIADAVIRDGGGTPNFIGVPGHLAPFEHATCISIDDEVVHGIPDDRVIAEGQIVSVDCGAEVDGWHGDSRPDLPHGRRARARRASSSEVTRAGMLAGVAAAVPGSHARGRRRAPSRTSAWPPATASCAATSATASATRCTRSRRSPTTAPAARVARSRPASASPSSRCSRSGAYETRVKADGWTVATADGSLAAHWEHTIAITADGPRVLTLAAGEVIEDLAAAVGASA